MLLWDRQQIGNRLLAVRKKAGLTQVEAAEAAALSNRAYADIERGTVNMRVETLLRICSAFYITPDELLTKEPPDSTVRQEELLARMDACPPRERETALALLSVYLRSLT